MDADLSRVKDAALELVDELGPEMDEIAHDLHEHPETGWDTPRSADRLAAFLDRHGLFVERPVAGLACAFRAYAKDRFGQHPAVCHLAEFDALPGLGHACGHNLIGTVASAAGIAVTRVLERFGLPGVVYVMGTPYEEGGGGKIVMLEHGVFDVADASLMFHPSNAIRAGSPNIAAHPLTVRFRGREAHAGNNPHEGANAADAAMIAFAAVNALRQHVTSDVRIHGIIAKAGDAPNTIPAYAEVRLIVRAATRARLLEVAEKVRNCFRAGALATGCQVEFEEGLTFLERVVVPEYRELGLANLPRLGLPVPEDDPQTFASADSGNVSYKIPHLTFNLPISDDPKVVPHTPAFAEAADSDRARQAMRLAAKWMALIALDVLLRPEALAAIQAGHRRAVLARS
ncbi:MAG: amidohydrolase [Clostridia bacterium]|nr:amidohydrolase [Clostridia bacterium]